MVEPTRGARWRDAVFGGALVAIGGALFGAARGAAKRSAGAAGARAAPLGAEERDAEGSDTAPARRAGPGRARVRTAPRPPEAAPHTQYWPPPPPKPADVYDDGDIAAEQIQDTQSLPVDRQSRQLGYERLDSKPGTIVKVMLSSVAVIVCCIAGLFYLIGEQRRDDSRNPPLTPQQLAVIVPPGPHLQDHPLHDIASENQREFDLLKYYAWSGPDRRSGRIPIARAQALVVGRPLDPLPASAPPGAPPAASPPAAAP